MLRNLFWQAKGHFGGARLFRKPRFCNLHLQDVLLIPFPQISQLSLWKHLQHPIGSARFLLARSVQGKSFVRSHTNQSRTSVKKEIVPCSFEGCPHLTTSQCGSNNSAKKHPTIGRSSQFDLPKSDVSKQPIARHATQTQSF